MTVRYLAKEEWTPFFNYISKTLSGSQAEIDVGSLLRSAATCRPIGYRSSVSSMIPKDDFGRSGS